MHAPLGDSATSHQSLPSSFCVRLCGQLLGFFVFNTRMGFIFTYYSEGTFCLIHLFLIICLHSKSLKDIHKESMREQKAEILQTQAVSPLVSCLPPLQGWLSFLIGDLSLQDLSSGLSYELQRTKVLIQPHRAGKFNNNNR